MCKRQHKHRSVRAAVPCCIRIFRSTCFAGTVTGSRVLKVNDLYAHVHACTQPWEEEVAVPPTIGSGPAWLRRECQGS